MQICFRTWNHFKVLLWTFGTYLNCQVFLSACGRIVKFFIAWGDIKNAGGIGGWGVSTYADTMVRDTEAFILVQAYFRCCNVCWHELILTAPPTSQWLLSPISYTKYSPQMGGSAPPSTKMLIGNLVLKAIAEFINNMLINLCNRPFT